MSAAPRRRLPALLVALAAAAAPLSAQTPQAPSSPTTAVLVNLTIKPGVDRTALMKTMPEEVRETVRLYLAGGIRDWYARADGRGVVFVMNSSSLEDAKAAMESLPLARAGYAALEFTPLQPLTPLRMLLGDAAPAARGGAER